MYLYMLNVYEFQLKEMSSVCSGGIRQRIVVICLNDSPCSFVEKTSVTLTCTSHWADKLQPKCIMY